MEWFSFQVIFIQPGHAGLHVQWPWFHEHHNHWWWVFGVRVRAGNQIVPSHFPYNENTRAQNTTSLKCSLPLTDTIDRQEKIHSCIWRFKVASCKCTSLKSTRVLQKKIIIIIRSDTFLTDLIFLKSHETIYINTNMFKMDTKIGKYRSILRKQKWWD